MIWFGSWHLFRPNLDAQVGSGLRLAAIAASSLVLLIVSFLAHESWPAISSLGSRMVTDASWHPSAKASEGTFGMWPIVVGTLVVTGGAVMLASPLGVVSAVFAEFYAPPHVAVMFRGLIELLAGIPSVVFGLWGLMVLAPLIARVSPPGQSLLAGVVIVTLMILPTVMLVTGSALESVPRERVRGAVALGMGRFAVIRHVVIPGARAGIVTGMLLGATRAMGETMAVLMVCGNVVKIPRGVFDPVRTLTANMALEMGYALDLHRSALYTSGLALLVTSMGLVACAQWLGRES